MSRRSQIGFIVLAVVVFFAVFGPILSRSKTHFCLDNAPFHGVERTPFGYKYTGRWGEADLGQEKVYRFHPFELSVALLHREDRHDAQYVLGSMALFLASLYCLKGMGFKGSSAYLPSLGLTFSGYLFTLISAGHVFTFRVMPFVILALGALHRGLKGQSNVFHYALTGVAVGTGLQSGSPDKVIILSWLLAAYGMFAAVRQTRIQGWKKTGIHVVRGAFVALLCAGIVAAANLNFLTRAASKQASRLSATKSVQNGAENRDSKARQQWEDATSWSLPPWETLEFLVPCALGWESHSPSQIGADHNADFVPYWGALGRPARWEENVERFSLAIDAETQQDTRLRMGQQFQRLLASQNYRQHTLYLGAVGLGFALFAILGAFVSPRNDDRNWMTPNLRSQIYFWFSAAVIFGLLACGRYTPMYRLFYAIPGMSRIRCPVKFVHGLEICTFALFAHGLHLFALRANSAPSKKNGIVDVPGRHRSILVASVCFVLLALVLLGCSIWARTVPLSLQQEWILLGRQGQQEILAGNLANMLLRSGGIMFFLAAVFAVRWYWIDSKILLTGLLIVIAVAQAADIVDINRRYIRTKDLTAPYSPNPVLSELKRESPLARIDYRMGPLNIHRDANFASLCLNEAGLLRSGPSGPHDTKAFFERLASDPLRLWALTSTEYILLPRKQAGALEKHPSIQVALAFDADSGTFSTTYRESDADYVALRFQSALPRACVFNTWKKLPLHDHLDRLTSRDWNLMRSVLVDGESDLPEGVNGDRPTMVPAEVRHYDPRRVEIYTESDSAGILLLNDRYDDPWQVSIDGQPGEIVRCNWLMRGVYLSEGKHTIVFEYHKDALLVLFFWIGTVLQGGVFAWACARLYRSLRQRSQHSE